MTEVVCDFCSKPDVAWSYPARSFASGFQVSVGAWAACNACHDSIEHRGVSGSIDCAVRSLHMYPENQVREYTTKLHTLFFANRTGPAVPFEEA